MGTGAGRALHWARIIFEKGMTCMRDFLWVTFFPMGGKPYRQLAYSSHLFELHGLIRKSRAGFNRFKAQSLQFSLAFRKQPGKRKRKDLNFIYK